MNKRQEYFCFYYVETGNGQEAAIRAGYSPRSAKQQAHRLLTYDDLQEKILYLQEKQRRKFQISLDQVIKQLVHVAFFDFNDIVEIVDGRFRLKEGAKLKHLSGISFSQSKDMKSFSIKAESRVKALLEIARILGLFDKNKPSEGKTDALSRALSRLRKTKKARRVETSVEELLSCR